ncbi:MAG: hypothetical protein O3A46_12185 [Candidatus Poribacteria bacterium]|nr:hypothetical protein [Candidatus Poribacteria bacterium]
MRTIPASIISVLSPFSRLFSRRVWNHAVTLVVGAILTPGKPHRRQCAAGGRAGSSVPFSERPPRPEPPAMVDSSGGAPAVEVADRLLNCPDGTVVMGIDETIERRRGRKIAVKGIYRDPVRSSRNHFVKASGQRWVCLMLLTPITWAARVWALPFLTVLAPSQRYHHERGKRHKTVLVHDPRGKFESRALACTDRVGGRGANPGVVRPTLAGGDRLPGGTGASANP